MDQREVQALLQLGVHHDIDIMVRPPSTERTKLYRLLEDGATGLMIPLQDTAADVEDLVQKVKFPPLGNRGIDAAGVDASFGSWSWHQDEHSMESWIADVNRETFLCVQIETRAALMNVDEIARVQGLDVMFVGPGGLGVRLKESGGNVPGVADYFEGRCKTTVAVRFNCGCHRWHPRGIRKGGGCGQCKRLCLGSACRLERGGRRAFPTRSSIHKPWGRV